MHNEKETKFKNRVKEIFEDEYSILGEYKNTRTKIKVRHNKCGHEYDVYPYNIVNGSGCPKCNTKKAKTTEEFKEEIYNLFGDEYSVLEEYTKSTVKIKVRHNKCGHEYKVFPFNILKGSGCPGCHPKRAKTTEEFKEDIYKLVGNDYEVLGRYINGREEIDMIHKHCGHIFSIKPIAFLAGKRCPLCKKDKTDMFKREVYSMTKNEYEVTGEYIYRSKKIKMKHSCGYEFDITPDKFLSGGRCPLCSREKGTRKNTEIYKKEVFDLVGKEYTVLGDYVNSNTKIKFRHNKCGHEYEITAGSFLSGTRCGKCFGTPKKTTSNIEEIIYEKFGDEYSLISEYKNARTKIKIRHNECGHEYEVFAYNISRKEPSKCPKCFGRTKKTTEQFKNEVHDLTNGEYSLIGEYINSTTHVDIRHNKCENVMTVLPSAFLTGRRCSVCSCKKIGNPKTTVDIKKQIYDRFGDEYSLIGEYKNARTKIRVRHNECGYEYEVFAYNLVRKYSNKCPNCSEDKR